MTGSFAGIDIPSGPSSSPQREHLCGNFSHNLPRLDVHENSLIRLCEAEISEPMDSRNKGDTLVFVTNSPLEEATAGDHCGKIISRVYHTSPWQGIPHLLEMVDFERGTARTEA